MNIALYLATSLITVALIARGIPKSSHDLQQGLPNWAEFVGRGHQHVHSNNSNLGS